MISYKFLISQNVTFFGTLNLLSNFDFLLITFSIILLRKLDFEGISKINHLKFEY